MFTLFGCCVGYARPRRRQEGVYTDVCRHVGLRVSKTADDTIHTRNIYLCDSVVRLYEYLQSSPTEFRRRYGANPYINRRLNSVEEECDCFELDVYPERRYTA